MAALHEVRFPGESDEYRVSRDELLKAEIDLRKRIEEVAAQRRKLPPGGKLAEDYAFDELARDGSVKQTKLSDLFGGDQNTLILYSFMYGPKMDHACPACTSLLDGANAHAPQVTQRVSFAVVAKSPIERIREYAQGRGWNNLRLLSSANNSYNTDYHGEAPDGSQIPACNVFTKAGDAIQHSWAAELLYAKLDGHPRHMDLAWPLWGFLDMTPDGRGDFFPKV